MNSVDLVSDGFERSAYSLVSAMDRFGQNNISHDTDRLERCVDQFRCSVDKLVKAMGMQAENDLSRITEEAPMYRETDFANL